MGAGWHLVLQILSWSHLARSTRDVQLSEAAVTFTSYLNLSPSFSFCTSFIPFHSFFIKCFLLKQGDFVYNVSEACLFIIPLKYQCCLGFSVETFLILHEGFRFYRNTCWFYHRNISYKILFDFRVAVGDFIYFQFFIGNI